MLIIDSLQSSCTYSHHSLSDTRLNDKLLLYRGFIQNFSLDWPWNWNTMNVCVCERESVWFGTTNSLSVSHRLSWNAGNPESGRRSHYFHDGFGKKLKRATTQKKQKEERDGRQNNSDDEQREDEYVWELFVIFFSFNSDKTCLHPLHFSSSRTQAEFSCTLGIGEQRGQLILKWIKLNSLESWLINVL